jgi:hypothetical protein
MQLADQVTSLAFGQRLKELGVGQQSLFFHTFDLDEWKLFYREDARYLETRDASDENVISAFTVAELGELLPTHVRVSGREVRSIAFPRDDARRWRCQLLGEYQPSATTEANVRAKMLIYLIEKNLVRV